MSAVSFASASAVAPFAFSLAICLRVAAGEVHVRHGLHK
jgi:hypothetical protein